MIAPTESRYSVNVEHKYVRLMGFHLFRRLLSGTGMALYDTNYKGQRIMYELGLQEALAQYADKIYPSWLARRYAYVVPGNDPLQSGTSYLDTYYGLGSYAFESVIGYDCPSHATYLNTSVYVSETTDTDLNFLCLFEYDADFPIQRHSTSKYVSNTKNIYFTIRIHDFLSDSMHDHVLNFKADFDILGTNNTMQLTTNVGQSSTVGKLRCPWDETARLRAKKLASLQQHRMSTIRLSTLTTYCGFDLILIVRDVHCVKVVGLCLGIL
ncbi:copper amine oxidase [Delphinella strobiligena]|nr:copper amine oxidase [Delphinella strobiligena]